jgi:hypothetical protein
MKVKFLQDFQGRETKNIFYKNNEVVDFDAETAELLVREKRAVLFVEPIEVPQIEVTAHEDKEPQHIDGVAEPVIKAVKRGKK